jgi:hypothetical protein
MEQSPTWEAVTQLVKKFHPLLYMKVHYHVPKSLPMVPILSQMHPVHTRPPHFPKIHSSFVFPYMVHFVMSFFFFFLNSEGLLASHSTPKLVYHHLSTVFSIYNPRTHHVVVTGTHITYFYIQICENVTTVECLCCQATHLQTHLKPIYR